MAAQRRVGRRPCDVAADMEAARALFWTLSAASLPDPAEPTGGAELGRLMADISERDFIAGARLRPLDEILDALDLFFRLQWSIERRMEALADSLPEWPVAAALQQRHRALRWFVCNDGDEPWDETLG